MTKKAKLLLFTLFLDICVFAYLTIHHYYVKAGIGGMSLCSINAKFNCDAAVMSSFSEVFNMPVAVLGASFHLVLFFVVLFVSLGWAEPSRYARNTIRSLLLTAAGISVVMAFISIAFVKVACPFCVITYLLSFINLAIGWNLLSSQDTSKDNFEIMGYLGEYKSHLYAVLTIPVLAWIVAGMISNHYNLDEMRKYVPEKLAIWKASAEQNFDLSLGISNQVLNPKFTLIEYADFKCPHCRDASKSIGLFLGARTDVLFIFKPFPLDGTCNPAINHKGDGSRCSFAAIALCSEKLASKGLEVTHWFFENQETFYAVTDGKTLLPQVQEKFGIDQKTLADCVDSAETFEMLKKSGEEGERAGVEGTPTIYLNNKKLPWGHVPEVLNRATQ